MRCLLVNPRTPETYWSLRGALDLVDKRWLVPPLPLLTVAAMLPEPWDLELVDLNVEDLDDRRIAAADVVMLTGMLVQRDSLHELLGRCRRLGVRTVVGGPYASARPDELDEADHLVIGEAEELLQDLARGLEAGNAPAVLREARKPDLTLAPVPRYDLLDVSAYQYMPVQFSRGCPFQCEFCDIITLYGRTPRTKSPEQVIKELEAILATGFRGRVMFVDDNFVGHKPEAMVLLRELARWREESGAELDFFTEASLDLADRPDLVRAMTRAGFGVVFLGLESPSRASLEETRKHQNLRGDPIEQVEFLRREGLDVWAGFIVGFDHDGPEIFDDMIAFIERAGIVYAMVGMLIALPGTPLHDRLAAEDRLRDQPDSGDMFAFTNVRTRLPEADLLRGYLRVLETLYDADRYYARCRRHLEVYEPHPDPNLSTGVTDLLVALRSLWRQGVRGEARRAYWRFLGWTLRRHPRKLPLAMAQACAAAHFLPYTRDTVAPTLRARLRDHAGRAF